MTSIGFHYFPDDLHYRATDLQAWLPELKALGAHWLTVIGSPTRAVPEAFLTGLLQAGIEPIVHLPSAPLKPADAEALRPMLASYARWGVRHVVVFAEPNARAAWPQAAWGQPSLVERFLDLALPVWEAEQAAGLTPVFPPLKAGGDYWDTAFLEAALAGLQRRGRGDLLKQMTFAINLWTFGRPLDWGAGGLRAWPTARPYATPPGAQDQRGFHLFDWYSEVITARVGEARPLLCLAGGPRPGEAEPAGSAVDDWQHAATAQEILTLTGAGQLPAHLLNINFWLLAAAPSSPFAAEAWYRPDGTTLTAVAGFKQALARQPRPADPQPKRLRKATAPLGEADPARPAPKALRHYLLLAPGITTGQWQAALSFVREHQPVCGFQVAEAAAAERVTVVGAGEEVEARLRAAGCVVERLQLAG